MFRSLLLAAVLLCAGLATQPASAQHFSFGISSGHGHHHHHHHGWHFDWHDCWHDHYYPRYVYAYPPPVIRERVYVEREPRVYESRSYQTTTPPPAADTLITIQNAAGRSVPVSCIVDSQDVSLRDGEIRTFTGRGSRVVEFDRGGDFGAARYDLTAGDYQFLITAKGWDLVRKTATSAADTAWKPTVRKNSLPAETKTR